MYYIRFIPSFPSSGKNIEGVFYATGSHIDAFLNPKKYKLNLSQELHYRLDLFHIHLNKMESTGLQNFLCLDFDQESPEKKKTRTIDLEKLQSELNDRADLKPGDYSINKTGYGFHIYLFFDSYFQIDEEPWLKPLMEKWGGAFNVPGFKIDRASFQARRTMRFPGSYYIKGDRENPSKFIYHNKFLKWESFKKKHLNLKDKAIAKKSNADLKTLHTRKPIDWQAIMGAEGEEWSGCRFIRWNWVAANEVNYQEWLAQLTITSRFLPNKNQAYDFCKRFNEAYEKFDEALFQSKFDEALKMHPVSCEHIASVWRYSNVPGKGCVDCPHRRLNQPLNITAYPNKDTGFRKVHVDKKGALVKGEVNFDSFLKWLEIEKKVLCCEDESVWVYNPKKQFYEPHSVLYVNRHFKNYIEEIKTKEMKELEYRFVRGNCFSLEEEKKKLYGKVIFKNGILDLDTGVLHEHEYYNVINNYSLNFKYDPAAKCPLYEELVDWAFYDQTERDFFFYFIVSALWTNISNQTSLILCGEGQNGKSSLMKGISFMYSKGSGAITPFDFMALQGDKSYFSLLNYSQISYCSDSDHDFLTRKTGLFKRIVGGESLSYRLTYARTIIDFINTSKLIIGLNSLPHINDMSYGLKRRLSVLRFYNKWPNAKKDLKFDNKLKKEGAGIFNFLYRYYQAFVKNPKFPTLSEEVYTEALQLSDVAFAFITQKLQLSEGENDRLFYSDIYDRFIKFCEDEKIPPFKVMERRAFLYKLRNYFKDKIKMGRTNKDRFITGVKFVDDTNSPEPQNVLEMSPF